MRLICATQQLLNYSGQFPYIKIAELSIVFYLYNLCFGWFRNLHKFRTNKNTV